MTRGRKANKRVLIFERVLRDRTTESQEVNIFFKNAHAPEMTTSLSINLTKMNSKDYASVAACLSKNYASVTVTEA